MPDLGLYFAVAKLAPNQPLCIKNPAQRGSETGNRNIMMKKRTC
jgi:hypothetical protein